MDDTSSLSPESSLQRAALNISPLKIRRISREARREWGKFLRSVSPSAVTEPQCPKRSLSHIRGPDALLEHIQQQSRRLEHQFPVEKGLKDTITESQPLGNPAESARIASSRSPLRAHHQLSTSSSPVDGDVWESARGEQHRSQRMSRDGVSRSPERPMVAKRREKSGHSRARTLLWSFGWSGYGNEGMMEGEGIREGFLVDQNRIDAEKIVQISCGEMHTLVLTTTGHVYAWGCGDDGRLGFGTTSNVLYPRKINSLAGKRIILVAAGGRHSFAYSADQTLYAWGRNSFGQCGLDPELHGEYIYQPTLVPQLNGRNITKIACGSDHTLVLIGRSLVVAFGSHLSGQLGIGSVAVVQTFKPTPIRLSLREENAISDIGAGDEHSLVLTDDGNVFSFGGGSLGQLGLGSARMSDANSPQQVSFPPNVRISRICCGWTHNICLTEGGEVYASGQGYGTGIGGSDPDIILSSFRFIESLSKLDVKHIACGFGHTIVTTGLKKALGVGNNRFGQLGILKKSFVRNPTLIDSLQRYSNEGVACGAFFSLILSNTISVEEIEEMRSLFLEADTGGDGSISINELEKIFTVRGRKVKKSQLRMLSSILDKDGNGFITWDEFIDEYPSLVSMLEQTNSLSAESVEKRTANFSSSSTAASSKLSTPRSDLSPSRESASCSHDTTLGHFLTVGHPQRSRSVKK